MNLRLLVFTGFANLLLSVSALAVINYGAATDNSSDPTNGLPWDHVGAVGAANASAIYLRNGYMLTANHVYLHPNNDPLLPYFDVALDGGLYQIDPSYTPTQIGTADLKVFRLTTNPLLADLTLVDPADDEFLPGMLTGFGKGKGAAVGSGYGWETDGSWQLKFSGSLQNNTAQHWGTNQMEFSVSDLDGDAYLIDHFNDDAGNDEGAITVGDSGSGYFIQYGATWKLVGLAVGVETSNTSYYDEPGGGSSEFGEAAPFESANYNAFVRIADYAPEINAATVPEPSTMAFFAIGSLVFWQARRSRPVK